MTIETPLQAAQVFGLEWREGEDRPDGHTFIAIAQTFVNLAERIRELEEKVHHLEKTKPLFGL